MQTKIVKATPHHSGLRDSLSPQRHLLLAAQAAFLMLLQGIPTGHQDKPYLLLSFTLALVACLPPRAAMIYGSICGGICDLLGSGTIGFYAFAGAIVCTVGAHLLHHIWKNCFLTRALFYAAAVVAIIGGYFLLFRAWQDHGLIPHYLWRMLLTYLCIFPLCELNRLGRSHRREI